MAIGHRVGDTTTDHGPGLRVVINVAGLTLNRVEGAGMTRGQPAGKQKARGVGTRAG